MLTPPIEPMLARSADVLPPTRRAIDVLYQAKVDGFRTLVFVREGKVFLQSRRGADLTPAFGDVAAGGAQLVGEDVVLDGELVVLGSGRLDFDALQQRARYRGRRATEAAAAAPAHLVVFDVVEHRGVSLMRRPLRERWDLLVELFERRGLRAPWSLVPCTRDRDVALGWFDSAWGEAGVEGCVVKPAGGLYRPGQRGGPGGWVKVRAYGTAEGIVAGVTGGLHAPQTLLLGRHDAADGLRMVARTTPLSPGARAQLGAVLVPAAAGHPWEGRRFLAGWGSREALEVRLVEPRVVVEFRVDSALDRGRHRHPVRYLRIRTDLLPDDL
ncbi:ATP-dependent DNA ligase [Streptomyces sp. 8L]|uniref:ATP-dependent DNA ligase n=1 Tax=Streptomyces sp. 8L TaxID=2877242 RepID=UPI001CD5BCA9|nr:ATP-dependent DNA ligase [Streptomyces sp. 8L]MCA1223391.1 ATP-dependent DNA ligase [Streptomyces sp. 8L]